MANISAYIGIFTDYWPNIGLGNILVSVADMFIQKNRYWQKYWPGTYIDIGIGWTNINLTLNNTT
jgi:hypothetical protein